MSREKRLKSIGATLRKWRESRSMTQVELARIIRCTSALISAYEKGLREPGILRFQDIKKALRVS